MGELKRALSRIDATWLVAGNMVGVGIFAMPGLVAEHLPGAAWLLVAWAVGGVLALAGAAVYGELGARHPEAGGDYRYLFAAFGPLPAFLSGWAAFLLTFSAAAAAMAMTAVDYLAQAVLGPDTLQPAAQRVAGVLIILGLTAANAAGSRFAGRTTMALTALPLVGLALLFIRGIATDSPALGWPQAPFRAPESVWPLALGAALVPIFFTYSGWNAAAYVGGEIRDARRDLPAALLIGTGGVMVLYLAVNVVLVLTLPSAALAGSATPIADAARRLLGPGAERSLALVIALAILGSANVTLMAGARIYYAMAKDGLAPASMRRVSHSGVPGTALWVAGVWSALLVSLGTFKVLVSWSTLAILLVSSLAVASLFVLRRRAGARTFRCPGYPVTPLVYLAAAIGVTISSVLYDPAASALGLGLVAAGVPVYLIFGRRGTAA